MRQTTRFYGNIYIIIHVPLHFQVELENLDPETEKLKRRYSSVSIALTWYVVCEPSTVPWLTLCACAAGVITVVSLCVPL